MYRSQTLLLTLFCLTAGISCAHEFSGEKALAYTREATSNGMRPSGSPALHKLQSQIEVELRHTGCAVSFDDFTATTPAGPINMRNILCKFPGKSGKSIVITGHYDTKRLPRFVGANDAGSSTGFLEELANTLQGAPRTDDVILVFFDGEEAVNRDWAGTDNTYGSRHLAEVWTNSGMIARIKALINVDMVGDKDLVLQYDQNSTASLLNQVWGLADSLGYAAHFERRPTAIEDDHMPFIAKGVPSLDIIDLSYGPNGSWWHTPEDTMDKLSAASLQIVGTVVADEIRKLEAQP
jgi:glutaminyl-peptide cyclotransferase